MSQSVNPRQSDNKWSQPSPPAPPILTRKSGLVPIIRLVQGSFFVLVALIAINHVLVDRGIHIPFLSSSSLHALCPFGGVTSLYQYIVAGTLVRRIQASSFVIMWLVFILAVAFGALFCGWICPLGTFQEAIARVGKKILGKRYNRLLPNKLDQMLRYMRYIVLILVVYMTVITAKLVFADYCPYDALFNSWTGNAALGGLIVLGITVALSLFVERPFCKYACPYGALLGLTNWFRVFKLKRDPETCISCGKCDQVCPMNLEISQRDTVNQAQCITCMQCTSQGVCPVNGALDLRVPRLSRSGRASGVITPIVLGVTIVVVFAGGILAAQSMGMWKTKGMREPARILQGAFAGAYDPADIRGAYTLAETSRYFEIPLETLAEAFGVPLELSVHVRHGDLEDYYHELEKLGTELGNGSVKWFVALYAGLPYQVDEPTYLLESAVEILENLGTLTSEQLSYIREHKIANNSFTPPDWEKLSSDITAKSSNLEIKGNTTFQDLLLAGLSQDDIESVLGGPMPNPNTTIQADAGTRSKSFGKIRVELQVLLEQR